MRFSWSFLVCSSPPLSYPARVTAQQQRVGGRHQQLKVQIHDSRPREGREHTYFEEEGRESDQDCLEGRTVSSLSSLSLSLSLSLSCASALLCLFCLSPTAFGPHGATQRWISWFESSPAKDDAPHERGTDSGRGAPRATARATLSSSRADSTYPRSPPPALVLKAPAKSILIFTARMRTTTTQGMATHPARARSRLAQTPA